MDKMKKYIRLWSIVVVVLLSYFFLSTYMRMGEKDSTVKSGTEFVEMSPQPLLQPQPLEMATFKEFMAEQTREVQERIWKHQHPARCDNVQFITTFHMWSAGYGSRQSYYRNCLTWAYIHNRVMFPACLYPEDCSVMEDWTNCTKEHVFLSQDPIECYWDNTRTPKDVQVRYAVPKQYSKPPFGYIWWHAQAQYYLTRLNEEAMKYVLNAHQRLLGVNGSYPDYGIHVRSLEKLIEARHFPLEESFERTMDEYPWKPHNESLKPVVFLSTDHEPAAASTSKYQNVKWVISAGNSKSNWEKHGKEYILELWVSILLLARSKVTTLTWTSNFAVIALLLKLVNEDFCSNVFLLDNLFFLRHESFQYIQSYTYQHNKESGVVELLDAIGVYGISNGCSYWVPNNGGSGSSSLQCVWDRRLRSIALHYYSHQYPTTCETIQPMYFGVQQETKNENSTHLQTTSLPTRLVDVVTSA